MPACPAVPRYRPAKKISYTITVQNTGNTTLTGVTVADPYADAGSIVRGPTWSATTTA
jgi:uncharacterized repeat protein (TIGR01451 family)